MVVSRMIVEYLTRESSTTQNLIICSQELFQNCTICFCMRLWFCFVKSFIEQDLIGNEEVWRCINVT